MKLTDEEKAIILAKREKEEVNKPYKKGNLKHNMYYLNDLEYEMDSEFVVTAEERIELINLFKENFNLIKKGLGFTCYLNEEGQEEWCDNGPGCCVDYPKEWADEHLENIKVLIKVK